MILEVNKSLIAEGAFFVIESGEVPRLSKVVTYVDDVVSTSTGSLIRREISWSFDDESYTTYVTTTSDLLLNGVDFLGQPSVWFKFKYTKLDTFTDVLIKSIDFSFEQTPEEVEVDKRVKSFGSIEFLPDTEGNLHKQFGDGVKDLEKGLNTMLNNQNGLEVEYYHVIPDISGTDVVLHEYTLHDVKDHKCLPIVLPDGTIPDVDPTFSEWGIEFQRFLIHIDKDTFEAIFGLNEKVTNESFIYIKEYNRLYTIFSSSLKRGVLGQTTYYECHLREYDDNVAVNKDFDDVGQMLDDITTDVEQFKEEVTDQVNDQHNDQQITIPTYKNDPVRETLDIELSVVEESVANNGTNIIDYSYDLSSLIEGTVGVTYKTRIPADMQVIGITNWFQLLPISPTLFSYSVQYVRIDNYILECSATGKHFYKENQIITDGTSYFIVDSVVDDFKFRILSKTTPVADLASINSVNLINVVDEISINKSIRVYLINGDTFLYYVDGAYHSNTKDTTIEDNVWIAMVLNINYDKHYLDTYYYEVIDRQGYPDKYKTSLGNVSKFTFALPDDLSIGKSQITYRATNIKTSNLRVWKKNVPEEHHNSVLNSLYVRKSSNSLIIDNSKPRAPYDVMGRSRTN